ncbi:MAG TPA: hypothetical protein VFS21_09065 [Roseiflexaceae bacterium]|nr:hypothetical protein [Roseiflexaceae bacterium]
MYNIVKNLIDGVVDSPLGPLVYLLVGLGLLFWLLAVLSNGDDTGANLTDIDDE